MQDCFRKYPDVYGAEIADEEAAEHEAEQLALDTPTPASDAAAAAAAPKAERNMAATPADTNDKPATPAAAAKTEPSPPKVESSPAAASPSSAGKTQDKQSDAVGPISEERGVPEKAFDATGANGTQSK